MNIRYSKKSIDLQVVFLLMVSLLLVVEPASAQPQLDPPTPNSPDANPKLYLPMMMRIGDLYISNIEITQSVQNLSSPVKLVANRPTVVRVYARTSKSTSVSNLQATLTAYRGSSSLGTLTLNGGTAYPASTSLDSLRASSSKSFNFQLPSNWITAGTLTLVADLDTAKVIPETNENNLYQQVAAFNSMPVLNVMAVPIEYYDYSTGRTYPPPSTSWLDEALYRMYPVHDVNVAVHPAYHFDGNLDNSSDWGVLLNEISTLKDIEGQPNSTVYFGVIPLLDSSGSSWFDGSGVVGYGWVGWRAAIGVTKATIRIGSWYYNIPGDDYAAHEVGHNFGRLHAPCGVTGESSYPYSGGIIGQYGFQVSQLPTQIVVDKNWTDIMSYCDNQWVSDYTYTGLYNNQVYVGNQTTQPETESLYLRVNFNPDGQASLAPVYQLPASPSYLPTNSEYVFQLLDSQGKPVAEYPMDLLTAEEEGFTTHSIRAWLPKPQTPFSQIRLLKSGQTLAIHNLDNDANSLLDRSPTLEKINDNLVLIWPSSGRPTLARYSTDGGKTWVVLGVDISDNMLKVPLSDLPSGALKFQIALADGGSWDLDYVP